MRVGPKPLSPRRVARRSRQGNRHPWQAEGEGLFNMPDALRSETLSLPITLVVE